MQNPDSQDRIPQEASKVIQAVRDSEGGERSRQQPKFCILHFNDNKDGHNPCCKKQKDINKTQDQEK